MENPDKQDTTEVKEDEHSKTTTTEHTEAGKAEVKEKETTVEKKD